MNSDKSLGAGLIAFGVAGIWMTMQITARTFNDDPGPKLFPIFGFVILIICGVGMLLLSKPAPTSNYTPEEQRNRFLRGTVMSGLFIVYSVGLWLVGFYVATPVAVYAFYHVIAGPQRRLVWRGAIYSIAVTGAVHLVFSMFLNTLLPIGILI